MREIGGSLALVGWQLAESQFGDRMIFSLTRRDQPPME
jgi:hypothetical protein